MKKLSFLFLIIIFALIQSSCGGNDDPPSPPPSIQGYSTVTGTIQYQDKEYGLTGFTTNSPYKNARYATVEVVDSVLGWVVGAGTADANGSYTINNFGYYNSTVYVRVLAEASFSGIPLITVKNTNTGAIYAAASANVTVSNGGNSTVDLTINLTNYSAVSGAFNILDVLTSGFEFVYSLTANTAYPPALTAYWAANSADGTYYCTGGCWPGVGIYIIGYDGGDTDGYDDDVIWHELGHFIADKFSKDDSMGGSHALTWNDLDLRLAWSEGWGDFFPGAIKTWLYTNNQALLSAVFPPSMTLSTYVDTYNSTGWYFDFGNPGGAPFIYSSSEAAVAKVLWDLQESYTVNSIWNIITALQTETSLNNLETFWDKWYTLRNLAGNPTELTNIKNIYSGRSIQYWSDTLESDNSINPSRTLAVGASESHTLYPAGDIDYIAFNVATLTQHTIKTTVYNGADTYLRLLNTSGVEIMPNSPNDNTSGITYASGVNYDYYDFWGDYVYPLNNTTTLASTITFTPTQTGIHYVEAKTSPNKPKSAGNYGSYTLTITSP